MVQDTSNVQVFHPEFLSFSDAGKNRKKANEVAVQGIRRSSTLVVSDRPEKIRQVDRVIAELDSPPVQILIESKLVEMAPVEANQIGVNWDKTLTTALQWQQLLPSGDAQDYSFLNADPMGAGKWQMGSLTASEYKAVLDFLKEKTDSKLISNPRLLAMDNEESSISVGTTVPVPRIQRGLGGQGDMVTFDYKEVNIQLNVTPHLGDNDEITMFVNPVIEEISGWVNYLEHRAPVTAKRTVNSIVSVRDGETVVIGGLIKTQRKRTKQKVWLLGSIPLLGQLFQHEQFEDKKTELMIFITPRVVPMG
jgi:general secretion pathway protein D